jgi:hypothetical protein
MIWKATEEFVYDNKDNFSIICNNCGFVASQLRLSQEEETTFYKDYRGEDYNNKRVFCEPWYKNYLDVSAVQDLSYNEDRQIPFNTLIDNHVDLMTINQVLDYGGANGCRIPENKFIKAKLFVYDISGVPVLPGILPYERSMKKPETVDFIMCCHVFEHLSDPQETMKDIKRFMHKDTWLYIEVLGKSGPPPGRLYREILNSWTLNSMTEFLNKNDIEIVEVKSFDDDLCILTKLK